MKGNLTNSSALPRLFRSFLHYFIKDLTFQFAAGGGHLQMAHEATNR